VVAVDQASGQHAGRHEDAEKISAAVGDIRHPALGGARSSRDRLVERHHHVPDELEQQEIQAGNVQRKEQVEQPQQQRDPRPGQEHQVGAGDRGDGMELFYARCAILHAARAAKIDAFDVVFSDVNDDEGFLKEANFAKRLGFNGKSLINPRQIELLHQAYAPTEQEVLKAQRIVHAAEEAESQGLGVVSLNGKMVDAPVVLNAQRILALAKPAFVQA